MKIRCCISFLIISIIGYGQPASTGLLRQKAMTLRRFLELNHYQPLQWNDTTSGRLYDKWIDRLDDEKLFFTQGDISSLESFRNRLDDELTGTGWDFFNRSITIYKTRVQKADSIIQSILSKPIDLSKPDNFTWPAASFATTSEDLTLRWQRYIKWRVLDFCISRLTGEGKTVTESMPADFSKIQSAAQDKVLRQERAYIKGILKTQPLFIAGMEDVYLDAIAWCYDPHTSYMNMKKKNAYQNVVMAMEYSAGLSFAQNEKGDMVVTYLQPGGSAWRSGQLHAGDLLIKLSSGGVEKMAADLEDPNELIALLNGNDATNVEVTVRTSAGETRTVKLVREKISAEEDIVKSYLLQGNKNIGYINLPGFYSREDETARYEKDLKYDGCANDVSKEIVKLKKDNISGLILDLRSNGGGSMWEAMQLAGIFIDIGPVASEKDRYGKVHFLKDPNRGTIYDGPMIVLVNGESASASEFVSAVLQDYNRALIVGGSTYGKGTAQVVLPMDTSAILTSNAYDDYVKVTQLKFYRVNGGTTQWKGVIPDISLPDIYFDESYREKNNSSALLPDNSKVGIYQPLPVLPIEALKVKSELRVTADPYFKGIGEFIKWYKTYQSGFTIALQWSAYVAQYKKAQEVFKLISDEGSQRTPIQVNNNSFDVQRIGLSSTHDREVNSASLDRLKKDMIINEAYAILIDWIVK